MANSVTKADLVSKIAAETGLKKVDAEKALEAVTAAIQGALQDGKKVTLVGFGTFDDVNNPAVFHDNNPVTHHEQFGHF